MKKFILFICATIIAVITILYLLDFSYTTAYASHFKRTKFQYFRSFEDQKIDYIFLGSSRVENSINPIIMDSITGKKAVNFGFQAAKLQDLVLLVKLFEDYNISYERLFIQLDYIYNLENDYSNVLEYQLIPFFKSNSNIQNYFLNNYDKNYVYKLQVPFLRYSFYDQKNGLREVVSNFKKNKTPYQSQKGFSPLTGINLNSNIDLPNYIITKNKYFQQLDDYCKSNNINVTYFCSAIRNDTKNLDYILKLKKQIPELIDFSSTIDDKLLFKDNFHLNENGAEVFTKEFSWFIMENFK